MSKRIAYRCDVCTNKFHGTFVKDDGSKMFLCSKHLHHMQRYGEIINRTMRDRNEIVERKQYCEIVIYSGMKGEQIEKCRAKIDKNYLQIVKKHKWCAVKKGKVNYIKTDIQINGKRKTLYLSNLILGKKDGFQIDHKNGDSLDNRKNNLRFCTQQQNLMNKRNSIGVWWNNNSKKWESYIGVNCKKIHLGTFVNYSTALKVRRKAELKYFGEFAPKR